MKYFYCPLCSRKSEKEDCIIIVQCGCGEYMVEYKEEERE